MQKDKIVYISISVVLVAIATYLFFSKNPMGFLKKKEVVTLKVGSNGEDVKTLQRYLAEQGQNVTVDGIFGNGTASALNSVTGSSEITVKELNKLT